MNLRKVLLAICFVSVTASTAFAHPQHNLAGDGLLAGFSHPWLGLDHLLAMVAVGLLSAQLGGRAMWILPGSFLGLMIVGGAGGVSGIQFHLLEVGLALSVVALGVALVVGRNFPLATAALVIGAFGLMHGHAHAAEMPAMATPALYAAGFVATTALLHVGGIVAGLSVLHSRRWSASLRISGLAISLAGVGLCLGVL